MTIAEVSRQFELSQDTLRYYERIGLIPRVNRGSNGIRNYTDRDCRWVKFSKCMRAAGLSIEALIEYVTLFQKGEETFIARKDLLIEQRRLLAEKIEEIQATLEILDRKIERYESRMGEVEKGLREGLD